MSVLKIVDLLHSMEPGRRDAIRSAIRGHVKTAVQREVLDKLAEAVEAASEAGMTDEEIVEFARNTLHEKRDRRVENCFRYRRRPSGTEG